MGRFGEKGQLHKTKHPKRRQPKVDESTMMYTKKRNAARTKVEILEDRRLMSAVTLTEGVLSIQGDTLSANRISLSLTKDGSQIQANLGRGLVEKVALEEVQAIEIRGGLKSDRITLDKKITVGATIYGDAGNDTITAGGGVDVVYGGLGNDRVVLSYVDTIHDLEGKNKISRTGQAPATNNVGSSNGATDTPSDEPVISSYTPTYFDPADFLVDGTDTDTTDTTTDETPVTESPVNTGGSSSTGSNGDTVTTAAATAATTAPAITKLTLFDAVTDTALYELTNGATINLAQLANRGLSIVAEGTATVASARFGYDSNANYRLENGKPFAIASNTGADYHAWTPAAGTHTLTVTGYTGASGTGTASTPRTITFTVVDGNTSVTPPASPTVTAPSVTSATLIDAVTNKALYTLTNGATINLATLANRGLNVQANVNSAVKSVKFGYDSNASYKIEGAAPFALAGDGNNGTDFYAWTPTVGTHTLKITGYSAANATGTASTTLTITFTVTDSAPTNPTTPTTPVPGDTAPTNGNQAPTVSFINPVNNEEQAYPGHYVIRVNAADSDGKVAKVEFFSNGNLISSTVDAPYSAAWVNVAAGKYTLTARVTDDDGATKSAVITVTIKAPAVGDTFYVSTGGSDSNSGSSSSPFRSISKAAALAGPGDTVIIRAGTYRETIQLGASGTATAPITFKAETPGSVIVSGSDIVSGWTRDGTTNAYSTTWNYDFFYSGTSRTNGKSASGLAEYAEQFVYQNKPLTQSLSRSGMTAGSFYVNWDTNKVYVQLPDNSNPANGQVLGSTRQTFFSNKTSTAGKYITVDGLTFRHAANFAQKAALKTSDGWVLKNSTIEQVNAGALGVYGENNFIYNNVIQSNGQAGMIGQGVNALIVDNTVRYNNYKKFNVSWDGGGGKMARTDGLYLLNHNTYGNMGAGFWLDVYNTNYTIDGGFFHDNLPVKEGYEGMGLELEINDGPGKVINASFYGNTGAGLTIAESTGVTVRDNYFGDNIELRKMAGRTPGLKDIKIESNVFENAMIANSIGDWAGTSLSSLKITANYNRFDNGGGAIWRFYGKSYTTISSVYAGLGVEKNGELGSVTIPKTT